MTDILVTPLEPGWFGVEVVEGHVRTGHRVHVPEDLFESGLPDADPEELARETVAFLLEREPATSLAPEFNVIDVSKAWPDYPEEIRARVAR
jgi:hypothetical protein